MIASTDFTIPFVLICLVALVWWITRQIRTYNVSASPARPDRHLPADEYRLLGDDYRDHAAEFFHGQVERDERLARALDRTCFAKNEGRDVSASGLPTSKEPNHAGKDQ